MREPTTTTTVMEINSSADNNANANANGEVPSPPPQALLERFKDYGQEHVFGLWDELTNEERNLLLSDIETLDLARIDRIARCSFKSHGLRTGVIEPVPEDSVATLDGRTHEERERWWKMGLKAIYEGKLAVLLLSGGQGTRLGSNDPKGCFDIGLPSRKSLFQLQAERILRVQKLASKSIDDGGVVRIHWYIMTSPFTDEAIRKFFDSHKYFGLEPDQVTFFEQGTLPCISDIGLPSRKSLFQLQAERILRVQKLASKSIDDGGVVRIHWYIMTSPFTDEAIRKFFDSHKYFGLEPDQVTFFEQGTLPCISGDGRFIMETPYNVAKAPDGNGGVYSALQTSKLLEDMSTRRIKFIDCYGVDNALVRVADPTFLGYFVDKGVEAAAKVVRKAYPQEKVGVFVQRGKGGPVSVVEYSELDQSLASEINQGTGRLRYCWSNVCLHMFTLDFLKQVASNLEKDSIFHLAEKIIPTVHGNTPGLKLEQFIFDAFTYYPSTALFEVLREEEFAPVKNANGSQNDTPDSARLMVLRLHSRWVVAAGGFITHSVPLYTTGVEISPLCSYAGENLELICRGRTFHAPCEITF